MGKKKAKAKKLTYRALMKAYNGRGEHIDRLCSYHNKQEKDNQLLEQDKKHLESNIEVYKTMLEDNCAKINILDARLEETHQFIKLLVTKGATE